MASKKSSKKAITKKSAKKPAKAAKVEKDDNVKIVYRYVTSRPVVPASDISAKAAKYIEGLAPWLVPMSGDKSTKADLLAKLLEELGGPTFEHPETGTVFTIATRGEKLFIRRRGERGESEEEEGADDEEETDEEE
jgi:hypothetical protein